MEALRYDMAALWVLWRREIIRTFRQPSRLIGALAQPIVVWAMLGTGMAASFQAGDVGYATYFFPGVVAMILVFASIFSAIGVIDDRGQGFLQAVMAGPASRTALVLGKCLGATSVACIQAAIFLALAPLAGFSLVDAQWDLLLGGVLLLSFSLSAFGFGMAWLLNNVQAYHAIQFLILMPLWVVSGAMFPVHQEQTWLFHSMKLNPVAYGVALIREGLGGFQAVPDLHWVSATTAFMVMVVATIAFVSFALTVTQRSRA